MLDGAPTGGARVALATPRLLVLTSPRGGQTRRCLALGPASSQSSRRASLVPATTQGAGIATTQAAGGATTQGAGDATRRWLATVAPS